MANAEIGENAFNDMYDYIMAGISAAKTRGQSPR